MTATTAALAMLAAIPKQDREALQKAHEAAAEFHAAMAAALSAERELSGLEQGYDHDDIVYWEKQYAEQLGLAAVAMQKVPVKWLAILGVKVEELEKK